MKELNKVLIYDLRNLSNKQRKELYIYLNSIDNKIDLKLLTSFMYYSIISDKWTIAESAFKNEHMIEDAIDLFEDTQSDFKTITDSIASLLEYKNEKYGNAALEPLNIFTNKTQVGQRIDDKLARIKNSDELRKNDVADLIGYLLLECKFRGWNNFDEFKD